MDAAEKTPGYNCRLQIGFTATRRGQIVAYYWSRWAGGGRWIRMGLEAARAFVAQDQADRVEYTSIRDAVAAATGVL